MLWALHDMDKTHGHEVMHKLANQLRHERSGGDGGPFIALGCLEPLPTRHA